MPDTIKLEQRPIQSEPYKGDKTDDTCAAYMKQYLVSIWLANKAGNK